jgi:hypothetical protein
MESHDEERIMIQSLQHGNDTQPGHNVRDTTVALDRLELGAAFLYTVPGPKMIWMFGEQGYDYSIDYNGRVGNKPLVWSEYMRDPRRVDTYRPLPPCLTCGRTSRPLRRVPSPGRPTAKPAGSTSGTRA